MRRTAHSLLLGLAFALVATACASPRLGEEQWVSGSGSDETGVRPAPQPAPAAPGPTSSSAPAGSANPEIAAAAMADGAGEPGYPTEGRIIGGPSDVEVDLATSFPRPDSILPSLIPKGWFRLKKRIYDCAGIKLALSFQSIY